MNTGIFKISFKETKIFLDLNQVNKPIVNKVNN